MKETGLLQIEYPTKTVGDERIHHRNLEISVGTDAAVNFVSIFGSSVRACFQLYFVLWSAYTLFYLNQKTKS